MFYAGKLTSCSFCSDFQILQVPVRPICWLGLPAPLYVPPTPSCTTPHLTTPCPTTHHMYPPPHPPTPLHTLVHHSTPCCTSAPCTTHTTPPLCTAHAPTLLHPTHTTLHPTLPSRTLPYHVHTAAAQERFSSPPQFIDRASHNSLLWLLITCLRTTHISSTDPSQTYVCMYVCFCQVMGRR